MGVESTVGKGSEFWYELQRTVGPRVAGHEAELEHKHAAASGPSRVILYVEDNKANMQLVKSLFDRRPDFQLLSAIDGISGVTLAHTARPDVILMDIDLPDISGFDAARLLASDPETAGIPVIALTANAMPREVEKGKSAGFFRYLTKPVNLNELMTTLDLALDSLPPRGVQSGGS